jgi:ankyrin repeat protein
MSTPQYRGKRHFLTEKTNQLYIACRDGTANIQEINELIKVKADVNQKNKTEHMTPLQIACKNGYANKVKILINAKADINSIGNNGSPLHCAMFFQYDYLPPKFNSWNNHLSIVHMLISAKADVNSHLSKEPPIIIAIRNHHLQMTKMLIQAKANIGATENRSDPLEEATKHGTPELVTLLKSK